MAQASRWRASGTVTSDPVLVEVLAYVSARGPVLRAQAAALVDSLRTDPDVVVVPQTRALFDAGLDLYRSRPDKGYSLTDSMSMSICNDRSIKQILSHDHHFEQEGYEILL